MVQELTSLPDLPGDPTSADFAAAALVLTPDQLEMAFAEAYTTDSSSDLAIIVEILMAKGYSVDEIKAVIKEHQQQFGHVIKLGDLQKDLNNDGSVSDYEAKVYDIITTVTETDNATA